MRERLAMIYEQHRQGLYALALSVARDATVAEEAVQEAFVRLCRRRRSVEAEKLTAYVYATVRNAAIDLLRKQKVRSSAPLSIYNGQQTELDTSEAAAAAEAHGRLREAVEELDEADRQVVIMKAYGQLTFQQIAEANGESINTVSSRYRRALAKLRERVDGLM